MTWAIWRVGLYGAEKIKSAVGGCGGEPDVETHWWFRLSSDDATINSHKFLSHGEDF